MGRERNSDSLIPEIKKIRLKELEAFCRSNLYDKFSTVPITPSRAVSYINNPDGLPEDLVLLLAFINEKLVAFRSLFAGVLIYGKNKIRFGWCSGSWVDPEFRRRGLSQLLLKEAYSDWNGRLMLTNYSPETESLYLKTGLFKPLYHFDGMRGYLFPKSAKLFPNANRKFVGRKVFPVIDYLVALQSRIRIKFYKYRDPENIDFEIVDYPDDNCLQFIEHHKKDYLFNRGAGEINWILNYPWISEMNREYEKKYPFSSCQISFYYRVVKVLQKNVLKGVCMFSVREGHLKNLYTWLPSDLEDKWAVFLKDYCVKYRLEMLTIYNSNIAMHLKSDKYPLLHVRNMNQKIYSSFEIGKAGNAVIQDGDGDRAFT